MKKQTNRNNKELGYVNYHRTKRVTTQPVFSSKNITSFFQDSTGQVKIELHTTISLLFVLNNFTQLNSEACACFCSLETSAIELKL